jgi:toxin secretion/phage lysis holin
MTKINIGEIVKLCAAGGGACLSYLYGGWSQLLNILLVFVVVDYITGVVASGIEGKLSSGIGMRGIAKKVFIFVIVAVAHLADKAIGNGSLLMDAAIFFYLANEMLSIIENTGRVGLPVPNILKQAVEVLKGKSDKGDVANVAIKK